MCRFLPALSPQLAVWWIQFRSLLPPVIGSTWWFLIPEKLVSNLDIVLFSFPNGLLFSSPIALFSILTEEYNKTNMLLLAGVILQCIIITSWYSPLGGESYGVRFLISCYPILITWFAIFIDKYEFSRSIIFPLMLTLTIFNFANILYFMLNFTGQNGTGLDQETLNRLMKFRNYLWQN